jgi:Cu/Ag efflux protein CusF
MTVMRSFKATWMFVVVGIAGLVASPVPAGAQKPVTQGAQITETFTIDAIDYKSRLVTLRDAKGETETIYCGPEVERFNALKVGDKVTFRYYESVVYAIQKPGDKPASGGAAIVRTPGERPGGTISQQMTATVTINAIDVKVPSVTITTEDGRKMSFKVENPKNLEEVKAGDKVQITYTQALAISVK